MLRAAQDPDWGSELNSGNRSWHEMSPARTHGPILYQGGALQPLTEPEHSFESLSSLSGCLLFNPVRSDRASDDCPFCQKMIKHIMEGTWLRQTYNQT